jgi:hypothetical protein
MRTGLVLAATVSMGLFASCSSDSGQDCTLMGAVSSAQVEVSPKLVRLTQGMSDKEQAGSLTVEACAEDSCRNVGVPQNGFNVESSNDFYVDGVTTDDESLVVSLHGPEGRVLATHRSAIQLETVYPNGPHCGSQVVMKSPTVRLG